MGQSQPGSSPISGFQPQQNVTHSQPQTSTTPLQGMSHPVSQATPVNQQLLHSGIPPPPNATQLPPSGGNGVNQPPPGMAAPPVGAAPPTGKMLHSFIENGHKNYRLIIFLSITRVKCLLAFTTTKDAFPSS